jgi:hypothetical protein
MTRNFEGVWIPRALWLTRDLTIQEKAFLIEINSLDGKEGCFASNSHFSEVFGLSKNRCTEYIKNLEAKKLISVEHIREGKRISKRILKVIENKYLPIRNIEHPYSENRDTPIRNIEHPYSRNREGSSTSINNTIERDARAISFLKNTTPERFNIWVKNNRRQIDNFPKFIQDFNDTVVIEGLEYDPNKLFSRLNKYARNWIENTNQKKRVNGVPSVDVSKINFS